jgi:hypothetical protein
MKNSYTHITIVLDQSGSMQMVKPDTIGGFNRFLADQQKQPGSATLTLVRFSDQPTVHQAGPVTQVSPLTDSSYTPGGNTALLDAIGTAIDHTGKFLGDLPEADRPAKVICVIMTDGQENSSRKFNQWEIADKIKHQKEVYKWDFVFIGADQDAIASASALHISPQAALSTANNAVGTKALYNSVTANITSLRARAACGQSVAYAWTDADREAQAKAGAKPA